MYYKVMSGTPLFDKLTSLHAEMQVCFNAAKELVSELGYKNWYQGCNAMRGGISAIIIPGGKPEGWVNAFKPHKKDAYMPRKVKVNKELLARIDSLPVIKDTQLTAIINYDWTRDCEESRTISICPGVAWFPDYILFDFSDMAVNYKPVKGMQEILASEYVKLNK